MARVGGKWRQLYLNIKKKKQKKRGQQEIVLKINGGFFWCDDMNKKITRGKKESLERSLALFTM